MAIKEWTGEDKSPGDPPDAYERKQMTSPETWLSHSLLEWGDYLSGSSDIQAANAKALPGLLGIPEDSECLYMQKGSYGYRCLWVRIAPPLPRSIAEARAAGDEDDPDFGETGDGGSWEMTVREQLEAMDSYAILDEQVLSELQAEWEIAAWDNYGKDDLKRRLNEIYPSLGDTLADLDWLELSSNSNGELHVFEGGEEGVHFRIDSIVDELGLVLLEPILDAREDDEELAAGFTDLKLAEILVRFQRATGCRNANENIARKLGKHILRDHPAVRSALDISPLEGPLWGWGRRGGLPPPTIAWLLSFRSILFTSRSKFLPVIFAYQELKWKLDNMPCVYGHYGFSHEDLKYGKDARLYWDEECLDPIGRASEKYALTTEVDGEEVEIVWLTESQINILRSHQAEKKKK